MALFPLPYGYYVFLRWVVCAVSLAAGVRLVQQRRATIALLGWALALLYNPLVRVSLSREIWSVVNVVTVLVLVGLAFALTAPVEPTARPERESRA